MVTNFARSRWLSAIGSLNSISSGERTEAMAPACRRRSGRHDSRRKTAINRSSGCVRLGAQFRRFRAKLDTRVAVKAMAAKLARLIYRMMRYGMKYVDQGARFYEAQHALSRSNN